MASTAKKLVPLACLASNQQLHGLQTGLVILNLPLCGMVETFKTLWNSASVKLCADGGANRLFDLLTDDQDQYVPNIISGDLDSVRSEVLDWYRKKGVEIVHTPDQDKTDFTKAVEILCSRQEKYQLNQLVAFNAFGGRIDQTLGNINTLFNAREMTDRPLYLMSEDSLACLLEPGEHLIDVTTGMEGHWCGLLPVGGKCSCITTTGLKWNLTQSVLEFGSLVSTSNTYDGSGTVTVKTNSTVLWTMGIKQTS